MDRHSQRLDTSLKLQQRLTPLQVQYVRMLEMTAPEMEDEVARALSEMPALEADDHQERDLRTALPTEDGDDFTESAADVQRADFSNPDDVPDYLESHEQRGAAAAAAPAVTGFGPEYAPASYRSQADYVEPVATNADETLLEALENQLADEKLRDDDRAAARYIIGSIDENGYLTRSIRALADDLAINEGVYIEPRRMAELLDMVRGFDPPGVGAVDLRDCLLLQLRRRPRSTEQLTALEVVDSYFDLLSKRHFDRIASALEIPRERLDDALELISRLNPKPGSAYAGEGVADTSRHISPDFLVEADADGRLTLTSLSRLPRLRVDQSFESDTAADAGPRSAAALRFIRAKRQDARNFIQIVEQRQNTIGDVVGAIVRLQHRFFITDDDEDIRPMVLRDISEATGYDLSTVSRATQGKYIATARGVYPLKKFFNGKLRPDDDSLTSNRIISEIRRAIAGEAPDRPLSDREIAARLADAGYDIARRTVAKYRESLGFPVARLRRR